VGFSLIQDYGIQANPIKEWEGRFCRLCE